MILLLQNDQILHPLPIPVQLLFLSTASGKQKPQLSQDDISGLCEPSTPSPLYLHPHPHLQSNHLTTDPASGQLFCPGEQIFITEMNCLIVSTQLPASYRRGQGFLWTGASCSDLASGVTSPTV